MNVVSTLMTTYQNPEDHSVNIHYHDYMKTLRIKVPVWRNLKLILPLNITLPLLFIKTMYNMWAIILQSSSRFVGYF
jgi:hypothetical protein